MNSFQTDENSQSILLSSQNQQVMMEWEKPYMEASIDFLNPKGDVLEIGFGLAYSASQIMKHQPKSYTVIECDPVVIQKAKEKFKEWAKDYPNTSTKIVEGRWQDRLHSLGEFDEIYFDDFPLEIEEKTPDLSKILSTKRLNLFLDFCIQGHTRVGSKISCYLNGNYKLGFSSDTNPFVKVSYKSMDIDIPEICAYRDLKEQKCLIPLIEKVKEYNFEVANQEAMNEIMLKLRKD